MLELLSLPVFAGLFEGVFKVGSSVIDAWNDHNNRQARLDQQRREGTFTTVADQQAFLRELNRSEGEQRFAELLLRFQQENDLECLRSELRLAEELRRRNEWYEAEHNPVDTPPGEWLRRTFTRFPIAPLVLFNTMLTQNASNPMGLASLDALADDFKARKQADSLLTVRTFGKRPFRADDAIDQFYHRELTPLPAVVIRGHHDGNALSIQAHVFGMLPGQLEYDGEELDINNRIFQLGRFSESLYQDLLAHVAAGHKPTRKHRATTSDLFAQLVAMVVNTSLQVIVDQYLRRLGPANYQPQALATFKVQLTHWQRELPGASLDSIDRILRRVEETYLERPRLPVGLKELPPVPPPQRYPTSDDKGPTLY